MIIILAAAAALLYGWIGLAAPGTTRILGLAGAALIAAALTVATRAPTTRWRTPAASALLLAGVLPLAVNTWWSLTTPVLAVLALTLGWLTIRHHNRRTTKQTH
jgi:hypothetical protein